MIATKSQFLYQGKDASGTPINVNLCEYCGLSTDTKPTSGIAEGSTFLEENTGKVFIFKADGTWVEL